MTTFMLLLRSHLLRQFKESKITLISVHLQAEVIDLQSFVLIVAVQITFPEIVLHLADIHQTHVVAGQILLANQDQKTER